MTEQEWLDYADDPRNMLIQLPRPWSGRKLRLLLCGCCRRFDHLLSDRRILQAAEVCERYVDRRRATKEELAAANAAVLAAHHDLEGPKPFESLLALCLIMATLERITGRDIEGLVLIPQRSGEIDNATWREAHCELIRELFGNPFRPVVVDPAWLTWHGGLLVSMARRMYDSRDFADMPILADALEDAGCANPDVLSHCRQQGVVHVRGCWIVDILLGKE
jgi:hypothetical protein